VHQQPPQTPLCFSTIRSKSGHVEDPSSLTEYRAADCLGCFVRDSESPSESTLKVVVNFFKTRTSAPSRICEYDSAKRLVPGLRDASCVCDLFSPEATKTLALSGPTIPASVTPGVAPGILSPSRERGCFHAILKTS